MGKAGRAGPGRRQSRPGPGCGQTGRSVPVPRGWSRAGQCQPPLLTAVSAVCSAAAGGLRRDELHNEVLHKGGGGGGVPVPATAPLLGGSPEKEGGGAASGDDFSELPRGTDAIRGPRVGRAGLGAVGAGEVAKVPD